MRSRGGAWAVYVNQDLSSLMCGHTKFLRFGEGCTYLTPPRSYPAVGSQGWAYLLTGVVDLATGKVVPVAKA